MYCPLLELLPLTFKLSTATAIIAGSVATAGYLDAKFHLRKDIRSLYHAHKVGQDYVKAGNRLIAPPICIASS